MEIVSIGKNCILDGMCASDVGRRLQPHQMDLIKYSAIDFVQPEACNRMVMSCSAVLSLSARAAMCASRVYVGVACHPKQSDRRCFRVEKAIMTRSKCMQL